MESENQTYPLKTVVFADSILAQPVFETLVQGGWAAGLCTSRRKDSGANLRHLAQFANIPVLAANRAELHKNAGKWLRSLNPDVLLVFAFSYRLPPEILRVPRFGAFNIHGGKLPEYRGPQPVFWQILNCEKEGAVTIHRMDEEFDRGEIVVSQPVPISPEDTYGQHSARIAYAAVAAAEALFGGLVQYGDKISSLPQDESRANFHPRPTLKDLVINWDKQTGEQIRALVKACNPWNQGAFASIRDINLRLTDVTLSADGDADQSPGVILSADTTHGISVNCRDGLALRLDVISMNEGIFPGRVLVSFGIQAGEKFETPIQLV
jgi:methionyl-tRNA formyltransferase